MQSPKYTEDISQDFLEIEAGIRSKTELFEKALALIEQTDLALVTVSFTVDEETIPQHLPSTFKWINALRMDLSNMILSAGVCAYD